MRWVFYHCATATGLVFALLKDIVFRMEMLARDEHSSLICQNLLITDEENGFNIAMEEDQL
jgi:hypothetical protein